jgi:hypothetical protein
MNAFREHHQHSIRLHYRCFDRILLNGIIQPFQQEERSSVSSTPIARCIPSAVTYCATSPRNFTTGPRTDRRGGMSRSSMVPWGAALLAEDS